MKKKLQVRWERHKLYGDVPLIRHSLVGRDGNTHEWWQYDPIYTPPLPRGAVAGEVAKQVFCATRRSSGRGTKGAEAVA